jgi:hypothetical protein
VVRAWIEARPEEMFITFEELLVRRRGIERVVRRATEVRFVFRVVLYVSRRCVWSSGEGIGAMPALLMRTGYR